MNTATHNNKPVFIINGSAGVGKDSFAKMCKLYTTVVNYSSIDKVKEIAREIGWDGKKDERSRKFLSDLKTLASEYNDMSFRAMKEIVDLYRRDDTYRVMFLHIREPEEIQRAKEEFDAETLLIVRDTVRHITSNMADANVFNYNYDYVIYNNETLDDLGNKAEEFLRERGIIQWKCI